MHPDAKKLWAKHRNPNCTACELHKSAQTVCLMGDGPVPAKIMVVGEAPGFREDDVKKPFAGKSGQLLRQQLRTVGINPDDTYITNMNKCRPPENRQPKAGEATACRPYIEKELAEVQPEFILTVGNHALKLIKKGGVLKHRGETFKFGESLVMPTVHPAAVLRNPRFKQIFEADINAFSRLVNGEASSLKTKTYLVENKKSLSIMLKAIMNSHAVAYDLETRGFEEWAEGAGIACISISHKPGISFVVPIEHPQSKWKNPREVLRIIGNVLMFSNCKLIAHNGKFDDRWLNHYGIPIHQDFDTMIAAHMLDENRMKGLKPLSQILLGADPWAIDLSDTFSTPMRKLAKYAGKDTDYTLRLYYIFREQLKQERRIARVFVKLMMPASKALTHIESNGIWVDNERLSTRMIETQDHIDKILKKFRKLAGYDINMNSPQQLTWLLFEKLKLPIVELTAGGKPSSKESVLLKMLRDPKAKKVAQLILEYRRHAKNLSTYLKRWAKEQDKNHRVHPNYKTVGTVTGRLASGKDEDKKLGLGVQQVPRDPFIRSIFGAPKGWKLVDVDFSQVELRIAAHVSGDETMTHYFNTGVDIHLAMAMRLTEKPAGQIEKEERKGAKGVNFGYLYGMGWKKYIDYAFEKYGLIVTEAGAKQSRNIFFDEYRSLKPWHERQRRLAGVHKQVSSMIGRVRHLPDIDSEDKDVRAEAERQAINSPVQSLASDMMLLSMAILDEKMPPTEAKIVGSIHDQLLFEIRDDKVDYWAPIIKHTMENLPLKKKFGAELSVPIEVEVKVGQHWGEGKVWQAA